MKYALYCSNIISSYENTNLILRLGICMNIIQQYKECVDIAYLL